MAEPGSADPEPARASGAPGPISGRLYAYTAHGLRVVAPFELPELAERPARETADIVIRVDEGIPAGVMASLDTAPPSHDPSEPPCVRLPDGSAAFRARRAGDFRVRDGRAISIAPDDDAVPGAISLFCLGSALGLALLQRGALVLHGASAVFSGEAFLVLGPRGAGKSTLASALGEAGVSMLGDDVAALWPSEPDGAFAVAPSGVAFKLWQGSVEAQGLSTDGLRPIANRQTKFYVPAPNPAPHGSYPVRRIFIIERDDTGGEPELRRLSRLEALQAVSANLYRPGFVDVLGLREAHFRAICRLVDDADVFHLSRPWGHDRAPETVTRIVDLLSG